MRNFDPVRRWLNYLHSMIARPLEGGAPGFVSPHHFGERAFQRIDIQIATAPNRDRLVVNRRVARHLRVQKNLLLTPGKRRGLGAFSLWNGSRLGRAAQITLQERAPRFRHFRFHAAANVTGRAVNPRNPELFRQVSFSLASCSCGRRRKSVSKAIWPSIRASGAPKQK